jgi:YVTN family beta-propeller protein
LSIDPDTDTIYAGNDNLAEVDVLNGATCDIKDLTGCAPVTEIPMADPDANVGAIDDATHTLYVSDPYSDTISVIDTATCNAKRTAGCAHPPSTLTVGPGPAPPVLDPATHTLYVPDGAKANQIAVINAATCNAEVAAGCGQTPAVIRVGAGTYAIALDVDTDTLYAPSTQDNTVGVIDGATCNATDHAGCKYLAATVPVGVFPIEVAVDDATHSVYVTDFNYGDAPGTVSVINGATCNGTDITGCGRPFATVTVGFGPYPVAVDTRTDTIYVGDYFSAAVSVLNGDTCNAHRTSGCTRPVPERAVGSQPNVVAVNQKTDTVYVTQAFGLGSMSIFTGHP